MAIELIQSTAGQEIPLGHFLSDTDGKTLLTALTIANTDIRVWKNGASALVSKNSGGATHMEGGVYYTMLDATDTSVPGPLVIFVHVAGALPVKCECEVKSPYAKYAPENYWRHSLMFQASGTPTATTVPVGTTQYTDLGAWSADNAYVGMVLMSMFQYTAVARVKAYNGTTKVLTLDPPLPFTPAAGDWFMLVPGAPGVLADGAITAAKIAANAITAAGIATDAIDGDALAASAVTEMQSGLATAAALATVNAYVDELESRLTAARAGYLDNLNGSMSLSAAAVDAILDEVVEGTITLRQAQRLMLASLTGKATGGGTSTVNFRDVADTKNRIVMTTDANGNRTAVTRDAT